MKKLVSVIMAVLLMFPMTGCNIGSEFDLGKRLDKIELNASDFVNSSHSAHENAAMSSDYKIMNLNAGIENNAGYLVNTIRYRVDKGTYRFNARLRVSLGNSDDPVTELHVSEWKDGTDTVIAGLNILGPDKQSVFTDYCLEFEVKSVSWLRFGVYSNGRNAVDFESMTLTKFDKSAIYDSYAKDLLLEDEEDQKITLEDGKLYYMDLLSILSRYDDFIVQQEILSTVVALQGMVNRDKPRLFVRFLNDSSHNQGGEQDLFWLKYLTEKNFLPGEESRVEVKNIGTLLRIFRKYYNGLVTWDNRAPATFNVAFTDCGVNNHLPVKYSTELRSFYHYFTNVLKLPVKLDLNGKFTGKLGTKIWGTDILSTGSKKSDPYYYAVNKYIKTKLTNPHVMSKYLDGWVGNNGYTQTVYYDEAGQLAVGSGGIAHWVDRYKHADIINLDYFVSKKAFFFDLSPVFDELPIDDLNQTEGLDAETFEYIMKENNKNAGTKVVEVGAFTNWQFKYSDASTTGAVDGGGLEPALSKMLTKYNAAMQADAPSISSMSNASVYTLFPASNQYDQTAAKNKMKEKSKTAVLENKNYILAYQGDYDGASWINRVIPNMFADKRRGDAPLMWPIVAVNEGRVKHVYEYMYEHATENDIFVGGNNGYGYNYLDVFMSYDREGINGNIDTYFAETKKAYDKYDLDVNGMYFGGYDFSTGRADITEKIYTEYAKIAPYGVSLSRGKRVTKLEDFYFNGATFMTKDPMDGKDNVIQCGNQNVVIEGDQQHQVSIHSQTINVTKLNRPHFTLIRPILALPTMVYEAIETLNERYPEYKYEIVDPYTFYKLYKDYCTNYINGVYN